GLDVVAALKQHRSDARAIILSGYGNIATAVKAVKLGAVDYLTKPVDADDIVSALLAPLGGKAEAPQHPMSPAHVRLQHIQQVHEATGRNVSETARRLNMHRRTLQRILTRRAGMSDCGSRRVSNSAALAIVVNTMALMPSVAVPVRRVELCLPRPHTAGRLQVGGETRMRREINIPSAARHTPHSAQ